jgi:hypothetical protein
MYDENFLTTAHKFSFENRDMLAKSKFAGCFYCLKIYPANKVEEWIDDTNGQTAQCPECAIDSVIGDASGIDLNPAFLRAMHRLMF